MDNKKDGLTTPQQIFMNKFVLNKTDMIPVFPGVNRRVAQTLEKKGLIKIENDYAKLVK